MIVACVHPSEPARLRYVALRYDHDDDAWTPIELAVKVFDDKFDAGLECLDYVRTKWMQAVSRSHAQHVYCEHFGTTSSFIRDESRALAEYIQLVSMDLGRMLYEPRGGDFVRVGDMRIEAIPAVQLVLRDEDRENDVVHQFQDIEIVESVEG